MAPASWNHSQNRNMGNQQSKEALRMGPGWSPVRQSIAAPDSPGQRASNPEEDLADYESDEAPEPRPRTASSDGDKGLPDYESDDDAPGEPLPRHRSLSPIHDPYEDARNFGNNDSDDPYEEVSEEEGQEDARNFGNDDPADPYEDFKEEDWQEDSSDPDDPCRDIRRERSELRERLDAMERKLKQVQEKNREYQHYAAARRERLENEREEVRRDGVVRHENDRVRANIRAIDLHRTLDEAQRRRDEAQAEARLNWTDLAAAHNEIVRLGEANRDLQLTLDWFDISPEPSDDDDDSTPRSSSSRPPRHSSSSGSSGPSNDDHYSPSSSPPGHSRHSGSRRNTPQPTPPSNNTRRGSTPSSRGADHSSTRSSSHGGRRAAARPTSLLSSGSSSVSSLTPSPRRVREVVAVRPSPPPPGLIAAFATQSNRRQAFPRPTAGPRRMNTRRQVLNGSRSPPLAVFSAQASPRTPSPRAGRKTAARPAGVSKPAKKKQGRK